MHHGEQKYRAVIGLITIVVKNDNGAISFTVYGASNTLKSKYPLETVEIAQAKAIQAATAKLKAMIEILEDKQP